MKPTLLSPKAGNSVGRGEPPLSRWAVLTLAARGLATTLTVAALGCSAGRDSRGRRVATTFDTNAFVSEIAGCYVLRTQTAEYLIRLDSTRSDGNWGARSAGRPNAAGDWWSWAPLDSARFVIRWSGIDGGLTYAVKREHAGLTAQETFQSANTKTETTQPADVRRISCTAPMHGQS